MLSAITVANAFISFTDAERGDLISNLKVQKLLYYAQGLHLAMYNEPLFKESIVKWQYGPVVKEVYNAFKEYGANAIPVNENFDYSIFNKKQLEVLHEINTVFGQFSAIILMNMTHSEPPYHNTNFNEVIKHEELTSYFLTQLE